MVYSARYHATSLIAVFLALAVGILIGAEFGGDALTHTRKNLENSLVGNLQDARSHVEDLDGELGHANEFDEKVYPVLTRDRLQGRRIALVAFGSLPGEITSAVEEALGPTGAELVGGGERWGGGGGWGSRSTPVGWRTNSPTRASPKRRPNRNR